ncbi:hypothetical protein AVEN_116724-1 [Araneus ventricosus]|uniref:Uncharacterized protein n=1 Tax=Araneus ventricosus TaxID=182803 RepID=A0A4Y2U5L4_ARAVE|nr:hypothetical protein AVEN_116724-1 [Araneus ventricosus]
MVGGAIGPEFPPLSYGQKKPDPFSGQQIASPSSTITNFPTLFLVKRSSTSNENFHTVSPFLVEKATIATVGEVKSAKKFRSGDLLVEVHSRKQSQQIVKLTHFSTIPITVSPHASLNSSKGVITCGELLNVPTEEILKELQGHAYPTHSAVSSANVSDIRKLLVAGHSPAPVVQKWDMKVPIAPAQRSVLIVRGSTLLFLETVLPGNGRKKLYPQKISKIKKQISYPEARKLVNSQTPTPGNSCVSVAKKSLSAPSVQKIPDASAVTCSKPSDSTAKASPPIFNLPIPSSPSVAPVSEEALVLPDFTDFRVVRNKKKLKKDSPTKTNHSITKAEKIAKFYTTSHREITNPIPTKDNISTLKPFPTTTPTSVDIELLPMAVLPPLEKILLQSRESDADAEMSSSSASEEDALEI